MNLKIGDKFIVDRLGFEDGKKGFYGHITKTVEKVNKKSFRIEGDEELYKGIPRNWTKKEDENTLYLKVCRRMYRELNPEYRYRIYEKETIEAIQELPKEWQNKLKESLDKRAKKIANKKEEYMKDKILLYMGIRDPRRSESGY